jgi:site-specific DNA recombinase
VRVSTTEQAQEGSSIEDQEKKIRAWCMINNMKLIDLYTDAGVSGTFMLKRPEFAKMMKFVQKGDTIVANDLGRVSRNAGDMAMLMKKLEEIGARAVFISENLDTSTTQGNLMVQVMTTVKQMEVKYTSERVKDTMATMKEQGKVITAPPYGWKKATPEKGSGLIEVPEHQEVISRIKTMHLEKKMSCYAIANLLTKEGVPTPRNGKCWKDKVVYNIANRTEVATKGRHGQTPKQPE